MNISKIIKRNKKSIALLALHIPEENNSNKGKISIRGTGFIISTDGKFVTCAHVYKGIPENQLSYLEVSVSGKTDEKNITHYDRYKVKLLKLDMENDIALMQIVSDNIEFIPIDKFNDSELLEEGEKIVFIGYPLATELLNIGFGITMNSNHSIISSVKRRGKDGSLHFFIIDSHVNNGSSGSPVFSINTGKMIGIISGKLSQKIRLDDKRLIDIPANLGICRPIQYIKNLIES